ncbi:MAG: hypothetical protein CVV49_07545 [Spirochaetae bacterium HGW-Spirochaetae-5]|nr:MAG: hypothetical protein CVV49_07545 [Spirochaetae bacterium HGW-Spirochaetae-5]
MNLNVKLKELSKMFGNIHDLTDSDRFMILATLTTDSASSLVITEEGKFYRDWIADNLSPILGYDMKDFDTFEKWGEIVHPEDIETFRESVKKIITGNAVSTDLRIFRKDKKVMWVNNTVYPLKDDSGRVARLISAVKDITERKIYEKEMLKTQRLESLGILAGGIAHDFNNILTAILGNISLAKNFCDDSISSTAYLKDAEKSIEGAKSLTKQLLTFARGGQTSLEIVELVEAVKQISQISLSGSGIHVKYIGDSDVFTIRADKSQIMQVFQNIIINSAQAMSWQGILTITFKTKILETAHVDLPPGNYISVQIKDEGPGIPDEDLENIFDPFFSTKESGSGLGLAVAHSIVKRHKGSISVQSSIKEGTTIEVLIPEIKGEKESENKNINIITNGTGSVLIMDDDENIIKILGSMLSVIGYSYDSVTNGDEAIERYKEKAGKNQPYSFVILDITIAGGMGGINCAEQIINLDKSAKIIFSSGYSSDSVSKDDFHGSKIVFLEKPYRIDELSKAISSLIAQ